jgi:hypothetical protein
VAPGTSQLIIGIGLFLLGTVLAFYGQQVFRDGWADRREWKKTMGQPAAPAPLSPQPTVPSMIQGPNSQNAGNVSVSNNAGPTQVAVNSPGASQVINNRRAVKNRIGTQADRRGNSHVLRLIFDQTDGIWDQGSVFAIEAQLSGPYTKANFTQGLPPLQMDVREGGDPSAGTFFFSMRTAPNPGQIVLEFESQNPVQPLKIGISPNE